MVLFVLAYFGITLGNVFNLFATSIQNAALLFLASILGFAAGSGTRGAIYLGRLKSGVIIGGILLCAAMFVGFESTLTVTLSGLRFAADTWAAIGAVIGFLAAKRKDVLSKMT